MICSKQIIIPDRFLMVCRGCFYQNHVEDTNIVKRINPIETATEIQFITISLVSFEMQEKTIERIAGIIGTGI